MNEFQGFERFSGSANMFFNNSLFFFFFSLFYKDKLALEQQQLSSRLQISALQSKLDETRHCYHDNTRDPTQELRDALDAAQQNLHCKEQEVCQALSKTVQSFSH